MDAQITENKQFIKITNCTSEEYNFVKSAFTKKIDGYRFIKKHLNQASRNWDGEVCYVKGAYIPSGLYELLGKTAELCKFPLTIVGTERLREDDLDYDEFVAWVGEFFSESDIVPRDYQVESAYRILKNKRCLSELATSAGKTLICFIVLAYVLSHEKASNILMIVPTIQLVDQSAKDFLSYNGDKLPIKIQCIGGGGKKESGCNITIGTFQTLCKWSDAELSVFDCVIVDECHRTKATSIKKILERCVNCDYRFGVTGTLPKQDTLDMLTLQAYIGPVVMEVKAKELQDRGFISNCNIVQMRLNYASEDTKAAMCNAHKEYMKREESSKSYALEKKFIIENEKRFQFLVQLLGKTTKNTLVLFQHLSYGKQIYDTLRNMNIGKQVYYIDGSTAKDVRNLNTSQMDKYDNVILVANFQVLSTGVSVNHIYNVVFAESYKSPTMIIQSIGRSLRLKDKENSENNVATIIDLVDDLRVEKHVNFTYRHGVDRIREYKEQRYPYKVMKVNLQ